MSIHPNIVKATRSINKPKQNINWSKSYFKFLGKCTPGQRGKYFQDLIAESMKQSGLKVKNFKRNDLKYNFEINKKMRVEFHYSILKQNGDYNFTEVRPNYNNATHFIFMWFTPSIEEKDKDEMKFALVDKNTLKRKFEFSNQHRGQSTACGFKHKKEAYEQLNPYGFDELINQIKGELK